MTENELHNEDILDVLDSYEVTEILYNAIKKNTYNIKSSMKNNQDLKKILKRLIDDNMTDTKNYEENEKKIHDDHQKFIKKNNIEAKARLDEMNRCFLKGLKRT